MSHIFISYSRRDTETVDRFVSELIQAGFDVWIDREDIKVGNTWRVQIVEAIDTCDAFVLVLSRNSAASDNVRKEIDLAQDSGRKIFVLLLEKIKIPAELRYQLAGLQFADVTEFGFDASTQGLTKALKEYVASAGHTEHPARLEVELVIHGVNFASFNQAKQEELLNFVSNLAEVNRSQLEIVNMAVGSVHVFMDSPAPAAFTLKTMALNHDKRFRLKNITELRLKGDKRFIKISAGVLILAAIAALLRTSAGKFWLSGCGCFTCLLVTGVLAWQAGLSFPPSVRNPLASRIPSTTLPRTITDVPTGYVPVTGPTETPNPAECFIAIPSTFAFEGPSRGYNVVSYERYEQGERFVVIMTDRSGQWLYGRLPDGIKGWLRIDWLTGECTSPAVPTASYIAPLPPTRFPTHKPPIR